MGIYQQIRWCTTSMAGEWFTNPVATNTVHRMHTVRALQCGSCAWRSNPASVSKDCPLSTDLSTCGPDSHDSLACKYCSTTTVVVTTATSLHATSNNSLLQLEAAAVEKRYCSMQNVYVLSCKPAAHCHTGLYSYHVLQDGACRTFAHNDFTVMQAGLTNWRQHAP